MSRTVGRVTLGRMKKTHTLPVRSHLAAAARGGLTLAFVGAFVGALVVGGGGVRSARADAGGDDDDDDAWVRVTVAGSVTTEDGLVVDDGASTFRGAAPPGFGLDVGLAAALDAFELGVLVSAVGTGSTSGVGSTQRLAAQARGTAYLRWSYLMLDGFDIFTGIGVGVAATRLSDFVRFELGRDAGVGLEAVTRSFRGLAVDVEAGMRIPLDDAGLRLLVLLAAHMADGEVKAGETRFGLFSFPTRLHVGLECYL